MGINSGRAEWIVRRVAQYLNYGAIAAIALSMLLTTVDAVLRYGFSAGIPGSYHLNVYLLVAIIAFPLAKCQFDKAHIRVDLVIHRIHGRTLHIIEFVTLLLALVLFAVATVTTGMEALRSYVLGDYEHGIINYPIWPSRAFIPIGTGIFCLSLAVDVLREAKGIFKPRSVPEV